MHNDNKVVERNVHQGSLALYGISESFGADCTLIDLAALISAGFTQIKIQGLTSVLLELHLQEIDKFMKNHRQKVYSNSF